MPKIAAFIISLSIFSTIYSTCFANEPVGAAPSFSCRLNREKHSSLSDVVKLAQTNELKFEVKTEELRTKFFKVGEVTSGPCRGGEVYAVQVYDLGPCGKGSGTPDQIFADNKEYPKPEKIEMPDCTEAIHAIGLSDKVVLIGKADPTLSGADFLSAIAPKIQNRKLVFDSETDWEKLFLPSDTLPIGSEKLNFSFTQYRPTAFGDLFPLKVEQIRKLKLLTSLPGPVNLYVDGRQTFLEMPDHVFTNSVDLKLRLEPAGDYVFVDFWENFAKVNDLRANTITKQGDGIKFKFDRKIPFLKKAYSQYKERIGKVEWDNYRPTVTRSEPIKFDEFVDLEPFLVEKDPLGRLQVFKKAIMTLPQMAEPLVYLYSDKQILVNIKFDRSIALIKTNPNYNGAWNLRLSPPNQIVDLASRRRLTTLFWEGSTYLTPPWDTGWVVRPSELKQFLDQHLSELGLNALEAKQFKSYWIPQMQTSPFYKIRFFDARFLAHYAPLIIEPKPDAVIRVHMDFQPIDHFDNLKEPTATLAPVRNGFTFVEWSGFQY